jgi:pentatricopeptide repeat protein
VDELAADGVVADPICFSEAMGACRKSGQWKITLKLLADMREAGAPPDPYTTSNAIAACAAGGQWEQALELLDELEEPNAVCYNAALSACARAGRWREALTLLKRLAQHGELHRVGAGEPGRAGVHDFGKQVRGWLLVRRQSDRLNRDQAQRSFSRHRRSTGLPPLRAIPWPMPPTS